MKTVKNRLTVLVFYFLVVAIVPLQADAQSSENQTQSGGDLRAKAQNPIASMYSIPTKLTVDFGAPNGSAVFFNINPVIPVTLGNWNLISRAIIPAIVSVDGLIGGTPDIPVGAPSDDRKTGIGDINYSLFFSPVDSKGPIWGVGPSLSIPTASDDQLGSGKWNGLRAVLWVSGHPVPFDAVEFKEWDIPPVN